LTSSILGFVKITITVYFGFCVGVVAPKFFNIFQNK